jgi:predicted cobalt transporter CbtA
MLAVAFKLRVPVILPPELYAMPLTKSKKLQIRFITTLLTAVLEY